MKIVFVCEIENESTSNTKKLLQVLEKNGYMIKDERYVYDEIIKEDK